MLLCVFGTAAVAEQMPQLSSKLKFTQLGHFFDSPTLLAATLKNTKILFYPKVSFYAHWSQPIIPHLSKIYLI
jgi:hypothetical protein